MRLNTPTTGNNVKAQSGERRNGRSFAGRSEVLQKDYRQQGAASGHAHGKGGASPGKKHSWADERRSTCFYLRRVKSEQKKKNSF